jgi:hypothetical protein
MHALIVDPREAAAEWGDAKKAERLVVQACRLAIADGRSDEVWRTLESSPLTREARVYVAKQALDASTLPAAAKTVLKQLLGGADKPRSKRSGPDIYRAFSEHLRAHPDESKRSLAKRFRISPSTALKWKAEVEQENGH